MAEGGQIATCHSLTNKFIPSAWGRAFHLPHESRQVCNGAKVPGAVEGHLAGREKIRYRSCVQARQISRHHVRSCGAVMNLYGTQSFQNVILGEVRLAVQEQTEN